MTQAAAKRASQLIALACSTPHTEEARTAALQAARIVNEYGLAIAPSADTTSAPPQASDEKTMRLKGPGCMVGAVLAFSLSFKANGSVLWGALHLLLNWFYVLWWTVMHSGWL